MGLLSQIKSDVQRGGGSKGAFFYVRDDEKKRVRFLQELDDGIAVEFYKTKWGAKEFQFFASPAEFGKPDPYADDDGYQGTTQYCWSVWDYDAEEVKIFMYAANRCSPVPPLLALNDTYGSVTDRDFMISVTGKRTDKTYQVVPFDKATFRNKKAKALSKDAIIKKISEAYPVPSSDDDEDDGTPWDEEPEESKYDSLSPKKLYELCKERGIKAEPKKAKDYYVKKLEDADKASDDWGDDDEDDDDWEDED